MEKMQKQYFLLHIAHFLYFEGIYSVAFKNQPALPYVGSEKRENG
jgi:hypothetical protein